MAQPKKRLWVVVFVVSVLVAAGCDWTHLGYGTARTGNNPLETRINFSNVDALTEIWTTTSPVGTASPIVAAGKLFLVDGGDLFGEPGSLSAFNATGNVNCSGTPKVCAPMWTASFQGQAAIAPAVANGVVYISTSGGLLAFDAAGNEGCSGTPAVCTPLWTGQTGAVDIAAPLVSNGIVYAGSGYGGTTFYAFDAKGQTNCAGSPRTCDPLWTATTGAHFAPPSEANGVVYVVTNDPTLYAFDADGVTNCTVPSTGATKTCTPLWHANPSQSGGRSTPMVAQGRVYLGDGGVSAYDAAGSTNCSGTPKTCSPLWDTPPPAGSNYTGTAIADGVLYASVFFPGGVHAFDAAGVA